MYKVEVKQQVRRKPKLIAASGVPVDARAVIIARIEEVVERYSDKGVGDHEYQCHRAN